MCVSLPLEVETMKDLFNRVVYEIETFLLLLPWELLYVWGVVSALATIIAAATLGPVIMTGLFWGLMMLCALLLWLKCWFIGGGVKFSGSDAPGYWWNWGTASVYQLWYVLWIWVIPIAAVLFSGLVALVAFWVAF